MTTVSWIRANSVFMGISGFNSCLLFSRRQRFGSCPQILGLNPGSVLRNNYFGPQRTKFD